MNNYWNVIPNELSTFPAVYRDAYGQEDTVLERDVRGYRMTVRGVLLEGHDINLLKPVNGWDDPAASTIPRFAASPTVFSLFDCTIEWRTPIQVRVDDRTIAAVIGAELVLKRPTDLGWGNDDLTLRLEVDGEVYVGNAKDLDDAMLSLQKGLPQHIRMVTCFGCAFSDYSVYGHGLSGMLCFRRHKDRYLAARDKDEYMDVMEDCSEYTYEMERCAEFDWRTSGTGYRG